MSGFSRWSVILTRLQNRRRMRVLRANSLYRNSEQSQDTVSHANRRLDSDVRLSEQIINTNNIKRGGKIHKFALKSK